MMITLTDADLARMPQELRNDLLKFVITPIQHDEDLYPHDAPPEDLDKLMQEFHFPAEMLKAETKTKGKNVIDINIDQAKSLIANLSDKSIETLHLFTQKEAIQVSSLVGEGMAYKDYIELKRSFVGPVNRRLRTVTGNKTAVLFLKEGEEEMAVKEITADSLATIFAVSTELKGK